MCSGDVTQGIHNPFYTVCGFNIVFVAEDVACGSVMSPFDNIFLALFYDNKDLHAPFLVKLKVYIHIYSEP